MKLYNITTIPNDAVAPVLKKAAKSVGARHSGVVVFVSKGRTEHYSPQEKWHNHRFIGSAIAQYTSFVNPHKVLKSIKTNDFIKTDGGYVKLVLPTMVNMTTLDNCIAFFYTAQHEFCHIRDFQHMDDGETKLSWDNGARRGEHRWRPEEMRAHRYQGDAVKGGLDHVWAQDEIINLAISIEQKG